MPLITRPQVYRVVRELLPKERFGPEELLLWLTVMSKAKRNERARCLLSLLSETPRCPRP